MSILIALILALSPIWVYLDATKNKIGKIAGAGGSLWPRAIGHDGLEE